ncbi:MAG: hypothetical protein FJ116_07095 [Deltaproteobacteria bacterium]|nr:hypothetical protein [Deltaproteobacteria bacterium]
MHTRVSRTIVAKPVIAYRPASRVLEKILLNRAGLIVPGRAPVPVMMEVVQQIVQLARAAPLPVEVAFIQGPRMMGAQLVTAPIAAIADLHRICQNRQELTAQQHVKITVRNPDAILPILLLVAQAPVHLRLQAVA